VLVSRLASLLDAPESARLLLVSRRVARRVNSAPYSVRPSDAGDAQVAVHPDDARLASVVVGARVRVSSDHGSLELTAHISADVPPRTVSLNHGWHWANVNALIGRDDVDRLTGQPQLTAIPVTIEVAAPAAADAEGNVGPHF
jgi:anaerobic selenocysteine-containing dehydrogenase